ncbi:MAG: T9SS type A sorting domain-containing protein [Bacteroidia bacterium]|nr:T9SS type A sorting domain-containing protein [Bacteroidia bacterium]
MRSVTFCRNAPATPGSDIDGEASEDASGFAVSFSNNGNRLAVTANTNDGNGNDAGHLRIFDWDGNNWLQLGDDIDGEFAGDRSGYSVSLSADGQRVAIGAPLNDGIANDAGHVRVYELPLMSTSIEPTASKGHIFEQISPNPALYKTELTFSLKIPGPVAIRLFDSMGKLISKKSYLAKQGINRLDWEVSQLTPGNYFFELNHQGETTFQKLIVR